MTLDQYADREVDLAALRRSIEQQLSAMPDAAPDILAALAAAELAGKIDAGETQMHAQWLRSRAGAAPNAAKEEVDDRTGVRVPAELQCKPQSGSAILTVSEGSILKDRYLLERKIGEGGMGVVFPARDLEEERIAREQKSLCRGIEMPPRP